jgi:Flp pilus assembly protein TadG
VADRRARWQQGSVLLLLPAGMLIVVLLGSIAVDFSIAYMGERELAAAAAAAANDAATVALDPASLRHDGRGGAALDRARAVVSAALDARRLDVEVTSVDIDVVGVDRVRVTVTGEVDLLFADAIPGGPDRMTVQATATGIPAETSDT